MRWLLLAAGALCASPAAAQGADSAAACPRPAADSARAVVRIEASVRARELRVEAPGQARAQIRPCTPAGAVRVERENLPTPLRPGATYRDAGVRVRILADPVIACRLAAALADSAAACPAPPRR